MERKSGRDSHLQKANYRTVLYAILIGVALDMLYLHYKTKSNTSNSNELQLRIDELQAQHESTLRNQKQAYVHLSRDVERKLHVRARKSVAANSQASFQSLRALRLQINRLIDEERRLMMHLNGYVMERERCQNVTLVCKQGERGPRGTAGPRGYKGEMGAKGDRGAAGPMGQRGSQGVTGMKG